MASWRSVLVVNPFIFDFKLYDEWMHPLGLYFLIDLLTSNGIAVHYFDCSQRSLHTLSRKYGTGLFEGREIERPELYVPLKRKYKCYGCPEETFLHFLKSLPSIDAIFIGSMMTYWAPGVIKTVELLRSIFPSTPIICGGIAVQLFPQFFKRNLSDVHLYAGGLFAKDHEVQLPGYSEKLVWHTTPTLHTALLHVKPQYHGPLLLSLGCPMHCSYCASRQLQPSYVKRPEEVIKGELLELHDVYGVNDFAFYDDALLVDAETVLLPLLKWIVDEKLNVRLHAPNGMHLAYCNESLLEQMHRAGFTTIRFGYESGMVRHSRHTSSKVDAEMIKKKCAIIQQYAFADTGAYIMGGLPESSPEEMEEEMRMIASYGIKVKPVFLSPVPGTPLFVHYVRQYPLLMTDPLWHNDTFFITQLPAWGEDGVERIRILARELNGNQHRRPAQS